MIKYSKFFHSPLPFFATQMINPFNNSSILANHDKVDRLSANMEKSYKGDCFSILESLSPRLRFLHFEVW